MNYMVITNDTDITVRPMQDEPSDYQLLYSWLSNKEVAQYYGGASVMWTLDNVTEEYRDKFNEINMYPSIIEYNNKPIGYIQFYETSKQSDTTPNDPPLWVTEGNYNIDLFIGDPTLWNQGIGRTVLQLLANYLLDNNIAKTITIDPLIINERAIRAYERAGFQKVEIVSHWDKKDNQPHDAWLMQYKK